MVPCCFSPVFLIFFCFVTVQSVEYKLKGQQVQLAPGITQQPHLIVWSHNGNIVAEYNHDVGQLDGSNQGRVTLDRQTARLQIFDIRLEDSGKYECEVKIGGKWLRSSFDLVVMERAAKPTITCQMSTDSGFKVSAVLLCIEDLSQIRSSFQQEWISEGKVQRGPWLRIPVGGELDEQQYTCRVSNRLSQENATFTAKDCYPEGGLSAGVIVLIVIVIVSILINVATIGSVCLIKKAIHSYKINESDPADESNSMTEWLQSNQGSGGDSPHSDVNDTNEAKPAGEAQSGMVERPSNQESGSDPQHSEMVLDEEKVPFLEDQPAALSPQPQNHLDIEED